MKAITLIVSCVLAMAACNQPEKQATAVEPTENEPVAIEVEPAINPERFATVRMQIAQLADPSFLSSDDFEEMFSCYLITEQGDASEVSDSTAVAAYISILDGETVPDSQAPVFEIKHSDLVVLLVKEKKAFANILLDKGSLTIRDIRFPSGSTAARLGSNTEKFRQQLNGSKVTFSEINFELIPWDDQIEAKGYVVIDGISGATTICQASIDMLNNQLPFYRSYLELSKK